MGGWGGPPWASVGSDSGSARSSINQPWARLRHLLQGVWGARGGQVPGVLASTASRGKGKGSGLSGCERAAAHTRQWLAYSRRRPRPPPEATSVDRCRTNPVTSVTPAKASSRAAGTRAQLSLPKSVKLDTPRVPLCSQPLPRTFR